MDSAADPAMAVIATTASISRLRCFSQVLSLSLSLPLSLSLVSEVFSLVWLSAETVSHYRMRRRGFQEDTRGKLFPFSVQKKDSQTQSLSRADVNFVGQAFLQRFQYPTIFLKISCDGDFLLPIVVGKFENISLCV